MSSLLCLYLKHFTSNYLSEAVALICYLDIANWNTSILPLAAGNSSTSAYLQMVVVFISSSRAPVKTHTAPRGMRVPF